MRRYPHLNAVTTAGMLVGSALAYWFLDVGAPTTAVAHPGLATAAPDGVVASGHVIEWTFLAHPAAATLVTTALYGFAAALVYITLTAGES